MRRKPPTKVAELPGAFFLSDTALAEHGDVAAKYEAAVADFELNGDAPILWEMLSAIGYADVEIGWHISHRGERMRQGYCA